MTENEQAINYIDWNINTSFYQELNPALKALDAKLLEYKQKYKGATLLVI